MKQRRHRGYALALVLLVSVILAGAVTVLMSELGASMKLGGKTTGMRKARYLCEGVSTLAGHMMTQAAMQSTASSTTGRPSSLVLDLEPLRAGVEADGVIINELHAEPTGESRISVVSAGPLAGMETATVELELKISLKGPDTPPCQARMSRPLASISIFQFPAMSPLRLEVKSTSLSTSMFVPGRVRVVWGAQGASVTGVPGLGGVSGNDSPLTLPSPFPPAPANVNIAFRPVPVQADLHFLLTQPGATGHVAVPDGLPYLADIRIVDGEWFLRDESDSMAWPGIPLWSDHACANDSASGACSNAVGSASANWLDGSDDIVDRRLYSHYERNGKGLLDRGGGAGVVSYGALTSSGQPAAHLSSSVCKDAAGFLPASSCGLFTSSDSVALAGKGGPSAGIVDAARSGFVDPDIGPILPININLGLLGFALDKRTAGELGTRVCLPRTIDDPGECSRVFNGIVYVTTTRGSAVTATSPLPSPAPSSLVGGKLPWPLCGTLSSSQASYENGESPGLFDSSVFADCEDANWARPNAVRLIGAADLSRFESTGLTIASDLPVYVVGDVNVVRPGAGNRVAFLAERVTSLSTNYSDAFAPQLGSASFPSGPLAPRPHARLTASIMAGTSSPGVAFSLIRTIEPNVRVDLEGSLAVGFRTLVPDRGPGAFHVNFPEELTRTSVLLQPPGTPRATFPVLLDQR